MKLRPHPSRPREDLREGQGLEQRPTFFPAAATCSDPMKKRAGGKSRIPTAKQSARETRVFGRNGLAASGVSEVWVA